MSYNNNNDREDMELNANNDLREPLLDRPPPAALNDSAEMGQRVNYRDYRR